MKVPSERSNTKGPPLDRGSSSPEYSSSHSPLAAWLLIWSPHPASGAEEALIKNLLEAFSRGLDKGLGRAPVALGRGLEALVVRLANWG